MAVLGIVTGVAFEAALLRAVARRAGIAAPLIAVAGLGEGRARHAAATLLAQNATHLLSFGLAAGLDPNVPVGTAIAATSIRQNRELTAYCDPGWAARLAQFPHARPGTLAHAPDVLATAVAKATARRTSGADAADMESLEVALAADAAGIPFAALRVISDSADQDLPPAALKGVGPDGTVRVGAVIAALMRAPGQIGGLLRLARTTARARGGLLELAHFGLPRGFFAEPGDE